MYGPGTSRSALSGTVTPGNAGVPVTHFHSVAARASSTLECPHAQRRRGRVTQAVGLTSAGPGRPAGCSRRQLPSMPRAHETRRGHCRGRSRRRAADTSPTCQAALPPLRHCRHGDSDAGLGAPAPGRPGRVRATSRRAAGAAATRASESSHRALMPSLPLRTKLSSLLSDRVLMAPAARRGGHGTSLSAAPICASSAALLSTRRSSEGSPTQSTSTHSSPSSTTTFHVCSGS